MGLYIRLTTTCRMGLALATEDTRESGLAADAGLTPKFSAEVYCIVHVVVCTMGWVKYPIFPSMILMNVNSLKPGLSLN
jgi:hypothetical protein